MLNICIQVKVGNTALFDHWSGHYVLLYVKELQQDNADFILMYTKVIMITLIGGASEPLDSLCFELLGC